MRTVIIIVCGFVLWGACIAWAKLVSGPAGMSIATATKVFVVLWFLAAAANLWVGVTKAGYAFVEELPIFLLIFLLPAAVAVAAWNRL